MGGATANQIKLGKYRAESPPIWAIPAYNIGTRHNIKPAILTLRTSRCGARAAIPTDFKSSRIIEAAYIKVIFSGRMISQRSGISGKISAMPIPAGNARRACRPRLLKTVRSKAYPS
jgi:hypothetical protein